MANDRSISLRMAVTGVEDGLATTLRFEQGQIAAADAVGKAWVKAGLPTDTLVERLQGIGTAAQAQVSRIDALAEANRRLGEAMLAGADVGGVASDAVASQRAYAEAVRQAAAEHAAALVADREATAAAREGYDTLAAAAQRYRESVDPTIALERLRAETADQVAAELLTQAEAYDRLAEAASRAAKVQPQPGQAPPAEVQRFATVAPAGGATGASAQQAVAAAQAQAAQNRILAETEREVDAALAAQRTRADQLRASIDPMIAVKRLQAETDLLVANNALRAEEAEKLLAVATGRAADQARAMGLASGQGVFDSSRGFQVAIAASQLQDLAVQLQNGTSLFTAFAEQAPQFGYAFGSVGIVIGTVVGIATALAGVLFNLSASHKTAAEEAKEQASALAGLQERLGLAKGSADELGVAFASLSPGRQDQAEFSFAAGLDQQVAAVKAAAKELDAAFAEIRDAAARAVLPQDAGEAFGQALRQNAGEFTDLESRSAAALTAYDKFKDGLESASELRDILLQENLALGQNADAAASSADKVTLLAIANRGAAEQANLVRARYDAAHGVATQFQRDLIDQDDATKQLAATNKAFESTLRSLTDQLDVAGSKRDEFVRKAVEQAKLTDADIARLGPDQRESAFRQREVVEGGADVVFHAREEADDRKRLADETARLAVEQDKLGASYDKVGAAGRAAADAERQRLTDQEGRLTPGSEALIDLARRQGESAERQTQATALQASALTDLFSQLGVVTSSTDAFADSIDVLDQRQKELASSGLEAAIERQRKAIADANQAASGALTPPESAVGDDVQAQATAQARAQAQALVDAYGQGAASLSQLKDGLAAYAGQVGMTDSEMARMIDTVVAVTTANDAAVRQTSAYEAELHQLTDALGQTHGAFTQADEDALNLSQSYKAIAAASSGFRAALDDIRNAGQEAVDPREKTVDAFLKSHHLDTGTIDKIEDPQQQAKARADAAEVAALEGIAFSSKKATEAERDHKAALDQLNSSLDRGAQSYAKVYAEKVKAGFSPELARQYAEDARALEAHNEATQKAGQQTEFARKSAADLAASERALTAARDGGVQATKESLAGLDAEQRVIAAGFSPRDRRYQQLVREQTQLVLNQQAGQDYIKQAEALQKVQEGLGQAQQIAALPVEGLSATREQRAELEASVEAIRAGFKAGTDLFDIYVKTTAQAKLLLEAEQDRVRFAGQMTELAARAQQARDAPIGIDQGGREVDVAELVGLDAASLRDVEGRAAAVRAAVQAIPESVRTDEAHGQQAVAEATRRASDAYDAEAAAKRRVAAVDLAAQASQDIKNNLALVDSLRQGTRSYDELREKQDIVGSLEQQGIGQGTPEFDEAFWTEWARRAVEAHKDAAHDAAVAWNSEIAGAITKPFEQIPQVLGKAFDDVFSQVNETGKVDAGAFATSLAQGVEGIGQNFLGNALQVPFKLAGDQLSEILKASLAGPGNPFANIWEGLNTFANKGALQSALVGLGIGSTVGSLGGTIGTAITGNQNTGMGGSLGGLAGGVAGSIFGPVGSIVGSVLGTAAGSFIGSLFGGDSAPKDRANLTYNPRAYSDPYGFYTDNGPIAQRGGVFGTGVTYQDSSASAENRERIRQVATALNSVDDLLASVGVGTHDFSVALAADNQGGISADGQKFSSADDVVRYYIDKMLHGKAQNLTYDRPLTATQTTILENTRAGTAQQLQQDLSFAQTYDTLARAQGDYGAALAQLDQAYGEAGIKAARLGLDTQALAAAHDQAAQELRTKSILSINELMGTAGPLANALQGIDEQFRAANLNAAALGVSEAQLNAARAKAIADARVQADAQYRQLTGQDTSGYANAREQVLANFRQAQGLAVDLGHSTAEVAALQNKALSDLRTQYVARANELIGSDGDLAQGLQQIRSNFQQAREIFEATGESVLGLAEKQAAAEQKLADDTRAALVQQMQSQAQQVRSFVNSLVDPLKQSLSGLGPLAGYIAPKQSLASGLAEFRSTFGKAANDDVQSIQQLPQEAQQLLQLARQNLGSGPQFAAIFAEVQNDLKQTLAAQQDRANQIAASIPDAIRLTGQAQLDALVSGFGDLSAKLDNLDRTIRLLQPGRLGQAA